MGFLSKRSFRRLLNGASMNRCKITEHTTMLVSSSKSYCKQKKSQTTWEVIQRRIVSNRTHHYLDELVIFSVTNFANVEEEDGELSEVDCIRDFREDSLEFYSEDLHENACWMWRKNLVMRKKLVFNRLWIKF